MNESYATLMLLKNWIISFVENNSLDCKVEEIRGQWAEDPDALKQIKITFRGDGNEYSAKLMLYLRTNLIFLASVNATLSVTKNEVVESVDCVKKKLITINAVSDFQLEHPEDIISVFEREGIPTDGAIGKARKKAITMNDISVLSGIYDFIPKVLDLEEDEN